MSQESGGRVGDREAEDTDVSEGIGEINFTCNSRVKCRGKGK